MRQNWAASILHSSVTKGLYVSLFCYFSGITRLPVLEGEVSHVEIPRTSPNLGITIVGGADTPLVSNVAVAVVVVVAASVVK